MTYLCTLVWPAAHGWNWSPTPCPPGRSMRLGAPLEDHHEPLGDARAAATILIAAAAQHDASSIEELAAKAYLLIGSMHGNEWEGSRARHTGLPLPSANPDADPSHPFYGHEVAFTGALLAMPRGIAEAKVAEVGGQPARNVTKRTNILVTGYQDPRKLTHGLALSRKAQHAADLRAAGQQIEVMLEQDFIQMLKM